MARVAMPRVRLTAVVFGIVAVVTMLNATGEGERIQSFIGCYIDENMRDLAMKENLNIKNTAECLQFCRGNDLPYAGVQNRKECYCDFDYGKYGRANNQESCNYPCSGQKSEICGGKWRNSVYQVLKVVRCTFNRPNHHSTTIAMQCVSTRSDVMGAVTGNTGSLERILSKCIDENNPKCNVLAKDDNYKCEIATMNDQQYVANKFGNYTENCDDLTNFYRTANAKCKSNSDDDTMNIPNPLPAKSINYVNWSKVDNIAVVCLLSEQHCAGNMNLTMRIKQLVTQTGPCTSFQSISDGCCKLKKSCLAILKSTNCEPGSDTRCDMIEKNRKKTMPICDKTILNECYNSGYKITRYLRSRKCPCDSIRPILYREVPQCRKLFHPTKEDLPDIPKRNPARPLASSKANQNLTIYMNAYQGPVLDLLEIPGFAGILPRSKMAGLTIADISAALFGELPLSKKMIIMHQSLTALPQDQKRAFVKTYFESMRCAFVQTVSVDTFSTSLEDRALALDMCNCNEQYIANIPAKVETFCKVILLNLTYDGFVMHISDTTSMCTVCMTYILTKRPAWEERIMADDQLRALICDKVGSSFLVLRGTLSRLAKQCTTPSQAGGCVATHPSLLAYKETPPSTANLASCKELLCRNLCKLTIAEIAIIKGALASHRDGTVGCLAYLDNVPLPMTGSIVNHDHIDGTCALKSRVIKRSKDANQNRKKRAISAMCREIAEYINYSIDLPSAVDVTGLTAEGIYSCVKTHNLGDYRWDYSQARTLFRLILQEGTLDVTSNLSGDDIQILGFIGLAFNPTQLATLRGVDEQVYRVFGAVHGWSAPQLRALASRYLIDTQLQPSNLTHVDIALLNHLLCGFSKEQITQLRPDVILNAIPILGAMKRCNIEVLVELVRHIINEYRPVSGWREDDFSEFGILLAGVRGEDLQAVGTALSDHIDIPFVEHIPPKEFRKLSPAQTSLFSYRVALAISKRGLCPWLPEPPTEGNLVATCDSGVGSLAPLTSVVFIITSITSTYFFNSGT